MSYKGLTFAYRSFVDLGMQCRVAQSLIVCILGYSIMQTKPLAHAGGLLSSWFTELDLWMMGYSIMQMQSNCYLLS